MAIKLGNLLKVCENCDFRIEQFNIKGNTENVCILNNKTIGLLCYCEKYKRKTGEHITQS